MKSIARLFSFIVAVSFLNGCAPSSSGSSPGPDGVRAESGHFLSGIDSEVAANQGNQMVAERFYVLMARLSVFALICDPKNERKDSTTVSKLWNASTEMQKNASDVFGGDIPSYNRFEKQRNIESRRLSFESGPTACADSRQDFVRLAGLSANSLSQLVSTTPFGSL